MSKCKYCKKQIGGEWNAKKDAGIIAGHGRIITDKFIVIPKGFRLRPFGTLGSTFNLSRMTEDDLEFFKGKTERNIQFDASSDLVVTNTTIGHVYEEGDVIPDMFIEMQLTWEDGNGNITYFPSGIITERTIFDSNLLKHTQSNDPKKDINIKNDSMKYSDSDINVEWFRGYLLSDLLKKIKNAGKTGAYWILACREGELVVDEKECGSELITKKLRSSSINVLGSFTDKIKTLATDIYKFNFNSRVPKLIRESDELKDMFITNYVDEIIYRLQNDLTIDSNLLCDVNNLIYNHEIPFELYANSRDSIFFKDFWKSYSIIYKSNNREVKRRKKDNTKGFKFIFK